MMRSIVRPLLVIFFASTALLQAQEEAYPTRGMRFGHTKELGTFIIFPQAPNAPCGPFWGGTVTGISERFSPKLFNYAKSIILSSPAGDTNTLRLKLNPDLTVSGPWVKEIAEVYDPYREKGYGVDPVAGLYVRGVSVGGVYKVFERPDPAFFALVSGLQSPPSEFGEYTNAIVSVEGNSYWNYYYPVMNHEFLTNEQIQYWVYDGDGNGHYERFPVFKPWFDIVLDSSNRIIQYSTFLLSNEGWKPKIQSGGPYLSSETFPIQPESRIDYLGDVLGQLNGLSYVFLNKPSKILLEHTGKGRRLAITPDINRNMTYRIYSEDSPTWFPVVHHLIRGALGARSENDFQIDEASMPGTILLGFVRKAGGNQTIPPVSQPNLVFAQNFGSAGTTVKEAVIGKVLSPASGAIDFWFTPNFNPSDTSMRILGTEGDFVSSGEGQVSISWDASQGLIVYVFNNTPIIIPKESYRFSKGQRVHLAVSWQASGIGAGSQAKKVYVFANGSLIRSANIDLNQMVVCGGSIETSDKGRIISYLSSMNRNWAYWLNQGLPIPRMKYVVRTLDENHAAYFNSYNTYTYWIPDPNLPEPQSIEKNVIDGNPDNFYWGYNRYFVVHFPYRAEWDTDWSATQDENLPWASEVRASDEDYGSGFPFPVTVNLPRVNGVALNPDAAASVSFHSLRIHDGAKLDFSDYVNEVADFSAVIPNVTQILYPPGYPYGDATQIDFPSNRVLGEFKYGPSGYALPAPIGWNMYGELCFKDDVLGNGNSVFIGLRQANIRTSSPYGQFYLAGP